MNKLVVLGCNGQLARAIARLDLREKEVIFLGRRELDLENIESIAQRIQLLRPKAVINAAAMADVDRAESEPDLAFRLNRDAPEVMAHTCAKFDIPFVHVSTDYVFDGRKNAPYVEADLVCPINAYGLSKAAGEQRVLAANNRAAIVRTATLYDQGGGRSFLTTILRKAAATDEIRVVADEPTRPTWAGDLARACVSVAQALLEGEARASGLLHFAGPDDATWIEYASEVLAASQVHGGPVARIVPVIRSEFPQAAPRPRDTRLDSTRIASILGSKARSWREMVRVCVAQELARTG